MEQKTIATTETMTQEQARQIGDRFVAKFPKAGTNFPKDIVQGVSDDEMEELIAEFIESLKTRVEHRAKVIIRHFKVDRTKTPAQLLSACNRVPWYVDETVLATMPMDGPEEGDLLFFPLEKDTPVADISRVFEERGLVPDYAAQMQMTRLLPINIPTGCSGQRTVTSTSTGAVMGARSMWTVSSASGLALSGLRGVASRSSDLSIWVFRILWTLSFKSPPVSADGDFYLSKFC